MIAQRLARLRQMREELLAMRSAFEPRTEGRALRRVSRAADALALAVVEVEEVALARQFDALRGGRP